MMSDMVGSILDAVNDEETPTPQHILEAEEEQNVLKAPVLQRPKTISTAKFKKIMNKSHKKYDVDRIVNDLDNGDGQIALKDISGYRERIQTIV